MFKLNPTNEGYQKMIEKILERNKSASSITFQSGLLQGVKKTPSHGLIV